MTPYKQFRNVVEETSDTFQAQKLNPLESLVVNKTANDNVSRESVQMSLQKAEERYQSVINATIDGFLVLDENANILEANEAYCQMSGYSAEELLKVNLAHLKPPEKAQDFGKSLEKLHEQKQIRVETQHLTKDGRILEIEIGAVFLDIEEKRIGAFCRDITERKQIEDKLRHSEERYRAIIEQSSEGIWRFEITEPIPLDIPIEEQIEMIYRHAFLAECNDAMAKQYGFATLEDLQGVRLDDLFVRSDKANTAYLQAFFESGCRLTDAETHEKDKRGNYKYFLNNLIGFIENGKLVRAWGTQRDITAQRAGEAKLRENEQMISAIAETAPNLIYVYDLIENRNLYTNRKMEKMFGYSSEEVLAMGNRLLPTIIHPDDAALVAEKMEQIKHTKDGEIIRFEYRLRHKSGDWRWIMSGETVFRRDAEGKALQKLGFAEDITERKFAELNMSETEGQIRQAQKMEAIGKLSGGIAHDFNNLLAVIMLQIDMLDLQLASDSPLRYRVGEIKSATGRAAALTRQLLAFSRKQMLQPRAVNLNQIVAEMGKILHRLIGEDIELEMQLAPVLDVVLVDPDQVSQVLMNLAVNARDAMIDGGKITIETKNVRLTEKTRNKPASQAAGKYVQLTVTDTGCGMDTATQERIFEPFFTTKEAGKGTGLGLSTVYGIIKQSGGYIWVSSTLDQGTTFKVELPCMETVEEIEIVEEPHSEVLFGTETILLVEDEELIRRAAFEVLSALGYRVLQAKDGLEAIGLVENFNEPIDLILTDVIMPKMNGKELVKRLKPLQPKAKVMFMSGYTDDIIARHGVLEEDTVFLEKPFVPKVLATKVREALEAKIK